jgi:hypothetical protein
VDLPSTLTGCFLPTKVSATIAIHSLSCTAAWSGKVCKGNANKEPPTKADTNMVSLLAILLVSNDTTSPAIPTVARHIADNMALHFTKYAATNFSQTKLLQRRDAM